MSGKYYVPRNMPKLANRELAEPYKWIETDAKRVSTYTITPRNMILTVLTVLLTLAICAYAIDGCGTVAHAETLPSTMNVTCKDGTVAHDVVGSIDAPCRKHGGAIKVIATGNVSDSATVADSDPNELHKVADCRDGQEYWSNKDSKHGACDGHQGVKAWADGSPVKVKKATLYRKRGDK